MKRNFYSILTLSLLLGVTSCGSGFPKDVESNLVSGEDYIDHAETFDGKKFEYDSSKWYVNELKDVPLPDPHVFVENDVYYIVGTSDSNTNVVECYSTKDFTTYKKEKDLYNPYLYNGWEHDKKAHVYAPEIYKFDDVYYLYYSAYDETMIRRNSVVVADNVLGPYEPLVNEKIDGVNSPVFVDKNKNFNVLDSTIFVDDDNQMYMYYAVKSNVDQHVVGVKMNSPYEADWSTYVDLVVPGALSSTNNVLKPLTWELYRENLPIVEAPYMIKSNGKYYLTYSVNGCWNKYYNVCYAVSDTPLGNYTKPYTEGQIWTNLLLGYPGLNLENSDVYKQWSGFASGTGHHCFFNIGDQVMIGYHAHQNRDHNIETKWTARYFALDYLYFDENGVPFCNGPTYSIQTKPEALSGYKNIAKNASIIVQNVENATAINDNYISDCYNLKQEEGKEVVLNKGLSYIEMTFDKEYEIGGFAIYNSSYYDKAILEAKYVDFGNGNAVKYPQFCVDQYFNDDVEFVFPGSAITVEFEKEFKSNKVVICIDAPLGGQINEIVILGK